MKHTLPICVISEVIVYFGLQVSDEERIYKMLKKYLFL